MATDLTTTPLPRIRPAVLQAFDAATWTATVQVTGSLSTYLAGVPVAKNLNAQLLTTGARVGVVFFDDANPTDAAVAFTYGAVPAAWITSAMIVDSAVATTDIADLAVTTAKINDLAVTTGKVADLAITTGKLADLSVTTGKLADGAVTSAKIANGNVTNAKLDANAVTTGALADNAVSTAKIADGAVTSAKIANGTVVGADCSSNVANGVATYDASAYLTTPSRIYPSNQATRYLYDDGYRLRTNDWLRATNLHADASEGTFLAGADGTRYSRFLNRILSTNYMAIIGINAYPNGTNWYRDQTTQGASIFACHDAPLFVWYTKTAGGSDPFTWTEQMRLDTNGLGIGKAARTGLDVDGAISTTMHDSGYLGASATVTIDLTGKSCYFMHSGGGNYTNTTISGMVDGQFCLICTDGLTQATLTNMRNGNFTIGVTTTCIVVRMAGWYFAFGR